MSSGDGAGACGGRSGGVVSPGLLAGPGQVACAWVAACGRRLGAWEVGALLRCQVKRKKRR